MEDIAAEFDFHGIRRAQAAKGAAREILVSLGDAVINERMEGRCHCSGF